MSKLKDNPGHGGDHRGNDPQTGPLVTIIVDDREVSIHRGRQTVSAIKQAAGVAEADQLQQSVDGRLVKLPQDGAVTIKGGERFVSFAASGASS